jgi:hypothetical protein
MIKELALLAALALVTGCAHHTTENRVVMDERSSPYLAGDTYRSTTAGGPAIYGGSWNENFDNTTKGAGARALMVNPYKTETSYSTAPVGGAVRAGEPVDNTTKGAGARELKQPDQNE